MPATPMDDEVWPRGRPSVGDAAELSRTVSSDDIARFTEISGDRNPLHYDAEAARQTVFGEIIVQGGITSAILNAVVAERLPGPGTVFLHVEWDFRAGGQAHHPAADHRHPRRRDVGAGGRGPLLHGTAGRRRVTLRAGPGRAT